METVTQQQMMQQNETVMEMFTSEWYNNQGKIEVTIKEDEDALNNRIKEMYKNSLKKFENMC